MGRGTGWALVVALGALAAPGCSLGPKAFRSRDLHDPAPLVRARAATLGDQVPTAVAVPALLARMNDNDPVVRMTAHEELRRRTGQDFGYHPWDDLAERSQAIARWQTWWERAQAGPNGAAVRPVASRRGRWGRRGG